MSGQERPDPLDLLPPQFPCPVYDGAWWTRSYGFCTCGGNHRSEVTA